jgi:hypothetical protein
MLDGGYYCPYCNQQADADQWFTKAQIEYVRAAAIHDATGPLLDQLEASVERFNPSGSGMISARFERDDAPVPSKPSEPDDMRRVEFSCHAKEPVKVLEAWTEPVHCLICGNTV